VLTVKPLFAMSSNPAGLHPNTVHRSVAGVGLGVPRGHAKCTIDIGPSGVDWDEIANHTDPNTSGRNIEPTTHNLVVGRLSVRQMPTEYDEQLATIQRHLGDRTSDA
jgi:hypothetical protein